MADIPIVSVKHSTIKMMTRLIFLFFCQVESDYQKYMVHGINVSVRWRVNYLMTELISNLFCLAERNEYDDRVHVLFVGGK